MGSKAIQKCTEKSTDTNLWRYPQKWMKLAQNQMERLSEHWRSEMRQRVEEYGESEIACIRLYELQSQTQRRASTSFQIAVKIFIITVGAVTFSAGARVFTASLGRMALPASLAVGGVASFCVDRQATRTLTHLRKRQSTGKVLKSLDRQKQEATTGKNANELVSLFYEAQISIVRQIEGKNLLWQFPLDCLTALGLSATELVIAIWLVNTVSIFGGGVPVAIRAIAASMPVILTWAASAIQSEFFELPEDWVRLIPQYRDFLFPPASMSQSQISNLLLEKAYREGRIDAGVRYILDGDSSRTLKNLAMALAAYDIQHHQNAIRQLEQERKDAVMQRLQDFQQEKQNLLQQAPQPSFQSENLSERQRTEERERIKAAQRQWVAEELPKREARCQEDLQMLDVDYRDEIQRQQKKIEQAQVSYEAAFRGWKVRREESLIL